MTQLVVQESVIIRMSLSAQYDILPSNVVLLKIFKKMAYIKFECHFVYTMKTHKYEWTCLLEKYAHNATQYEVKIHI